MGRPRRRLGNLPAETTSFVGRRRELAEGRSLLASSRLVSLVGPGGVGKTRLAVRLATDLGRGFEQGAWWVELAEVGEPGLLAGAVASALDLRVELGTDPLHLLLAHVRDSALLLVLDNCEHLLDAAAGLADAVLRAAPGVRVIATSREPLQVPGEHVLPVPPLGLPPRRAGSSLAQLRQNEAVALFTERAAAATGRFESTGADLEAVAEVCRRLDGLPLAIELAAVRTRVLTAEQILDRLSDRFALLTGGARAALPRQQTLRTAIDWSYDLLSAAERSLLRRLCVFAGRFTLDDAEAVCAEPDPGGAEPVLDVVSALVDKSLVSTDDLSGVRCFRLHETMREYALARLHEAGETRQLEERYVDYYRRRCLRTAADARGHLPAWLSWVEFEADNIRLALRRCLAAADWRRGLELASALGTYWMTRGTHESARWFDLLLAMAGESPDIPPRAHHLRGWFSMRQVDPVAARGWFARASAAARASGQAGQLRESLAAASIAENMAGDHDAARRLLDEAESLAPDAGRDPDAVAVLQARSVDAFFRGDLVAADAAAAVGERLCRQAGDLYFLIQMLLYRGQAAMLAGDVAGSGPWYRQALRIARQIDDRSAQFDLLNLLAWQANADGQPRLAAQLLGAAEVVGASAGAAMTGPFTPLLAAAREEAVGALGAPGFAAAFEAAQRLDREDALRLALGERDPVGPDDGATPTVGTGPLAQREVEVARLVAEGLTNKQIGARLFISDRTVATHVRNIMDKLGFGTRSQIASWLAAAPDQGQR